MTHPLVFPPSRSLAEWWGQLASFQPTACWLAYIFLHHLEARVRCQTVTPLDRLQRLVLRAIDMHHPGAASFWTSLDERLYLGEGVLRQIVRMLADAGLVEQKAADVWGLSALGSSALAGGEYPSQRSERRIFTFVERLDPSGQRLQPPHFLAIQGCKGESWQVNDAHHFDPSLLAACIDRPVEWKQQFAFPTDVLELVRNGTVDAWRSIIIDRAEQLPIVLAATKEQLFGFAVLRDTWKLLASAPLVSLGAHWPEVLPVLTADFSVEHYQQAWRSFAQERGVAEREAAACQVAPGDNALRVQASGKVADALRRLRNDSAKGLTWTLIGDGAVRKLARVVMDVA